MYFRIYCSMEIVLLVLLYFLSQKPEFSESVKPLMAQLKNSEQMLSFLRDLSNFTQTFSTFGNSKKEEKKEPSPKEDNAPHDSQDDKNPQSPVSGIADEFIQKILDGYFNKKN